MVEVDSSNVWGAISLPDLLGVEGNLSAAHRALLDSEGRFRAVVPEETDPEVLRILKTAEKIREENDVLVVLGAQAECLCARGVTELIPGREKNPKGKESLPEILFAGSDFSSRQWNRLMKQLEGKRFSLCVLAGREAQLETLVALRILKWTLERRYGTDGARERIFAAAEGNFARMAREEGWCLFEKTDRDVFGPFRPGVLLVLAAAGLDIGAFLRGGRELLAQCSLLSYDNPLWLYAGSRYALCRRGKNKELLYGFETDFRRLADWWQTMTAREDANGPFPVGAVSGGAQLPQGSREDAFVTLVSFSSPEKKVRILEDARDIDGLNALAGRTLEELQEIRRQTLTEAAADAGTGVIGICFETVKEETLGALTCFFSLSARLSAGISGETG